MFGKPLGDRLVYVNTPKGKFVLHSNCQRDAYLRVHLSESTGEFDVQYRQYGGAWDENIPKKFEAMMVDLHAQLAKRRDYSYHYLYPSETDRLADRYKD